MAKLKVFITSDGLTDYVVAATSKAKALAAWGIRQDVFKEGSARETDDKTLVKAATAKPGEVLRRPAGTRGELERLKSAKPKGSSKAQLRKVVELESKLNDLDAAHEQAAAGIERERAELDRREEALHGKHEAKRAGFEAKLRAARDALA